ncbi:MAG TPA: hypothetical protein VGH56_10265, partial [Solirubrobacteraceae bacterium]
MPNLTDPLDQLRAHDPARGLAPLSSVERAVIRDRIVAASPAHPAARRPLRRAHRRRRMTWVAGRLKRRALVLGVPATAAAAIAIVLLTAGGAAGPSSASAAIIRHVRAELTAPPGLILHESATVTLADGSSSPFELWEQTGGTGVYRVIKQGDEVSLSDTKNEIYDPSRHTVTISPLPPQIHQREVS